MKKQISFLFVMLSTYGCSSYHPLPIKMPSKVDYENYKDTSDKAIPIPKDLNESKKYSWTFAEHYRNNKNALLKKTYNHNDEGFFGTLLAMASGMAKSPEGVVVGGAIAAGSEIAPARYQLSVQAANYESAEKGTMCVFDNLRKVSPEEDSNLAVYEHVIGKSKENTVSDVTHITMKQIHARLESAQSKVALLSPDLDKLQQALEASKKQPNASPETGSASDTLIETKKRELKAASGATETTDPTIIISETLSVPASKLKAMSEEGDKKLQEIKAKFDVCTQLVSN